MVCIKTCRLTRNPQLGDPVAWLNLTLADGRELDDVACTARWAAGGSSRNGAGCPPSWQRWWGVVAKAHRTQGKSGMRGNHPF